MVIDHPDFHARRADLEKGPVVTCTGHSPSYLGRTVLDRQGIVIGRVIQVYLDDETGQPQWVSVNTGQAWHYAPLHGSAIDGGHHLVLPFPRSVVTWAPGAANPAQLEVGEHSELYRYYQRHLSPDHR